MTTAIVFNVVLGLIVFSVIIAMIAWAIRTARPASVAPVPAHNPRVREHAVRARAAHADRARAARRQTGPVAAQA
jgi:hypothetical protein